ncbi:MAG TPA: SDR family NAD(P)-dependent oxidoreductase [Minicystis sp.]|nr:SDR family NAD(P)-dependent oxidoreductase [Minicystis sp.]
MSLPPNVRAVVTGAGSGIGRAFAVELGRRKGSVLCADLNVETAEETARLVEGAGGVGLAVRADVAKIEDVEHVAADADARLGGVDLVINNAGVAVGGLVGDVSLEDWRWLMGINLWGVVYGCHVFVPRLKKQGRGHVINVASAAGFVSGPRMGPYNVSKAGVIALSETLAGELAGTGVGVTVLCPTFIKTNIAKSARGNDHHGMKMVERLMEASKHTPEDVARMTLDAAGKDRLYVLPQNDARWLWRVKRLDPARFYGVLVPRALRAMSDPSGPDLSKIAKGIWQGLRGEP